MTDFDLTTQRGCMVAVLDMRSCCRLLARATDAMHQEAELLERSARLYRKAQSPMYTRRAEVLEGKAKSVRERFQKFNLMYREQGYKVIHCASAIDALLPQSMILDLLNVNAADRSEVEPSDGLMEIAYARGLENSAENRGKEEIDTPLHGAVTLALMHEMATNADFNRRADEMLFGRGGMFEFLPRATVQQDGTLKRMPPRLRIADPEIDGRGPEDAA